MTSDLPPGPGVPASIQTLSWVFGDPLPLLEEHARRFGDAFTIHLYGPGPKRTSLLGVQKYRAVVVSSPSDIHDVFADPRRVFGASEAYSFLEPLFGSRSLFVLRGDDHKRHRQVIQRSMDDVRGTAGKVTMYRAIDKQLRTWRSPTRLIALDAFQGITFRIIYEFLFPDDTDMANCRAALFRLSRTVSTPMILFPWLQRDFGSWSPGARIAKARAELRALIEGHRRRGRIAGRTQEISWLHDFLEAGEDGLPLSDDEIHDEVVTLLATGFETTAIALSFAIYHLLAAVPLYQKLASELAAFRLPDQLEELFEYPYLDNICRETLRLHPVVPLVVRRAREASSVGRWRLAEGDYVLPCLYLAHRRPDLFDKPSEFLPDRFERERYAAAEHLPFGGGVRHCIGKPFALQAMKITLALLLQRFEIGLADVQPLETQLRHITIIPRGGIRLKVSLK